MLIKLTDIPFISHFIEILTIYVVFNFYTIVLDLEL
jgi:hypothetical protein